MPINGVKIKCIFSYPLKLAILICRVSRYISLQLYLVFSFTQYLNIYNYIFNKPTTIHLPTIIKLLLFLNVLELIYIVHNILYTHI